MSGQNIRINPPSLGGVYNGRDQEFSHQYFIFTIPGRVNEADELNSALIILESPASSYLTGSNLVVDGDWTFY